MRGRRVSGVLVLMAAGLMIAGACGGDDAPDAPPATGSPTAAGTTPAGAQGDAIVAAIRGLTIPKDLVDGRTVGKKDAPVTLTMFEDFQCPFCLRFTAQIEPMILEEYVKPGKVRIEFRQWPILGDESANAAIASQCAAEQGQFWEFHHALFLAQAEAGQHVNEKLNAGRFGDQPLLDVAAKLGLDTGVWGACYSTKTYLATVQDDVRAARDAGLRGTPSFLLNGTVLATPSTLAAWRTALDAAVTKAKQ